MPLNKPSSLAAYMTYRTLKRFITVPIAFLISRSHVEQIQLLVLLKDPVMSGCVMEAACLANGPGNREVVGHHVERVVCGARGHCMGSGP